jgi:hypothetical protein
MARYRVAIEHINTHKIWKYDVEAEGVTGASTIARQEHDRNTSDPRYLFDVISLWRLNIPFRKSRRTRRTATCR